VYLRRCFATPTESQVTDITQLHYEADTQANHRQLKVAMLDVRVWDKCKADGRIVSNEKFDERLRRLVDSGELEAFGEITNWRFSEVLRKQDTRNRKTAE
jgi:hypothetical protein